MYRRLALIAAVLLTAAACQDDGPAATPQTGDGSFWSTVPQTDDQRLEVLRRMRAMDTCALLPRAELAEVGQLRTVGTDGLNSCRAELDSSERYKGKSVRWAMGGPAPEVKNDRGTTERLGDVTITLLADKDTLSAEQAGQLVQRSCSATARFPSFAAIGLWVDTPLGVEPCPIAKSLITTAVSEWKREPRQASAAETITTVLTGADPCAVLPRLGVTADPAQQRVSSCTFSYHGDEIRLAYEYSAESLATAGSPAFTVGDRTVYRDAADELRFYNVAVGPPLASENRGSLGPRLPAISLTGKADAALEDVVRQVLTLFP
ncbi:hypothetical protein ACIHAX_02185 [Nocardia sp. NPDC051929]|uniref:hypothetical protein n=1 Tax=Nocardia sp. NPDC051929 TaxID=3364327 RepID=UPI0037CAC5E2